jgi:hypothetical protein
MWSLLTFKQCLTVPGIPVEYLLPEDNGLLHVGICCQLLASQVLLEESKQM